MTDSQSYEYVDEQAINSNYICAICHTPLQNPRVTPCKHVFCHKCIQNWLTRDKSCPTCRQQLFPTELRKVMISFLNLLNEIPVRCTQCGRSRIPRGDFNDHIEKQCSKRIVGCKAADIDCPWRGTVDEVNDHTAKCSFMQTHLTNESLKLKNTRLQNELKQKHNGRTQLSSRENGLRNTHVRPSPPNPATPITRVFIGNHIDPIPSQSRGAASSAKYCNFCKNTWEHTHCSYRFKTVLGILSLAILMIFPMSALIVGQIYKNDCPNQSWVPLWMIIFGVVGVGCLSIMIVTAIITITCFDDFMRKMKYYFPCGTILGCFFFVWMLVGSAYVYPLRTQVQHDDKELVTYCHVGLYKFTLACLGIQHVVFDSILIGVIILVIVMLYRPSSFY